MLVFLILDEHSQNKKEEAHKKYLRFQGTIERIFPKYKGKVVQYFDDSCLLSFSTPYNGIECASDLQALFHPLHEFAVSLHIFINEVIRIPFGINFYKLKRYIIAKHKKRRIKLELN